MKNRPSLEWFWARSTLSAGGFIAYEFSCRKCESITIFKDINIPRKHLICANCENGFITKDLIRFDRTDRSSLGVLLNPDTAISERLHVLTNEVKELTERFERLEILVLDDREMDDSYSFDN